MPTARPSQAAYAALRATADLSRTRPRPVIARTILVVGTPDITHTLVHEVLTRAGHSVIHAATVVDAIFAATDERFDAIVIASLPHGEDAAYVASSLRTRTQRWGSLVPVVFYTASHDSARKLREMEELKPSFAVVKDGNVRALAHTVDTALRLCG